MLKFSSLYFYINSLPYPPTLYPLQALPFSLLSIKKLPYKGSFFVVLFCRLNYKLFSCSNLLRYIFFANIKFSFVSVSNSLIRRARFCCIVSICVEFFSQHTMCVNFCFDCYYCAYLSLSGRVVTNYKVNI